MTKIESMVGSSSSALPAKKKPRLNWAELLRRTFQIDMNECAICGGVVKFIQAVMKRDEILAILAETGPPEVPAQ